MLDFFAFLMDLPYFTHIYILMMVATLIFSIFFAFAVYEVGYVLETINKDQKEPLQWGQFYKDFRRYFT